MFQLLVHINGQKDDVNIKNLKAFSNLFQVFVEVNGLGKKYQREHRDAKSTRRKPRRLITSGSKPASHFKQLKLSIDFELLPVMNGFCR